MFTASTLDYVYFYSSSLDHLSAQDEPTTMQIMCTSMCLCVSLYLATSDLKCAGKEVLVLVSGSLGTKPCAAPPVVCLDHIPPLEGTGGKCWVASILSTSRPRLQSYPHLPRHKSY